MTPLFIASTRDPHRLHTMKSLFQSGQFFLASQHAELIAFETAGTAML